jgi:hypothetical protein
LLFFWLVSAVSLRQADIALRAAFTASRASFESPGIEIGLKLRGAPLRTCAAWPAPFVTEIVDIMFRTTLFAPTLLPSTRVMARRCETSHDTRNPILATKTSTTPSAIPNYRLYRTIAGEVPRFWR